MSSQLGRVLWTPPPQRVCTSSLSLPATSHPLCLLTGIGSESGEMRDYGLREHIAQNPFISGVVSVNTNGVKDRYSKPGNSRAI